MSSDASIILNLVSDMTDLAKLENGKFTLNQQFFDFASLLRGTCQTMKPCADLK